jgi:alpha-ketoglutarate-dependent taurine dioxygenase
MLERRGFRVEVEQDQRMSGTDRYNLYCVREGMTYSPGRQNDHWRQTGRRVWKRDLSPSHMKKFLKEQLPEYMVPAVIVMLKQLPINRNGKVDYEALPDPDQTQDHVPESLEHRTPYEEIIAGIWEEVLGVKVRSTAETFFDLGGHSLLATKVASRVRDTLKVELPLRTLFEKPSLSALAGEIEMLKRQVCDQVLPKIVRVQRTQAMPLSYGQQRLWFLDQLEPGSSQYNSWRAIRVNGTLDEDALDRAIKEIVLRHEILRTRYVAQNGVAVQEVSYDQEIEIEKVDLSREEEQLRESKAREIAREYGARGFDLETGPLMRLKLIRIGQGESVLVVVMHHIVSDAWSLSILVREVGVLYERFRIGAESPFEPLKIQYADFAHWQRTWMKGEALPKQLSYWTSQLGGKLPALALPVATDSSNLRTHRAERQVIDIDLELTRGLTDLSRKEGASLFMTLLTAFNLLLNRYSGQQDILVGTPIAGRNRREIEDLIGFFINMLVIRTDLSGNPSFIELLGRVKEVTLAAYAHQDTPFEKLVEILQPERNLDRTPLFQVTFGLQNAPTQSLKLTDVNLSLLSFEQEVAHYDLSVWMFETAQGLSSVWTYRADLFQAGMIAQMQKHFVSSLQSIVRQPEARLDAFDVLTDSEKEEQSIKKRKLKEQVLKKFITISPQAVDTSRESLVEKSCLIPGEPLLLQAQPRVDGVDLALWAGANLAVVRADSLKHGAILFRGFKISGSSDFERFVKSVFPDLCEYREPSSPRTEVNNRIYTSTEYPASQWIQLHNEMSYSHSWPRRVFFYCDKPAEKGGETPIASSRKVFESLDSGIKERFMRKGVMYVRNFHPGLDLSWQHVFQTEDRSMVEAHCRSAGIEVEWIARDHLRSRQIRQAVLKHPETGEEVWFNQAHAFHVSSLPVAVRESLLNQMKEEDLPRNAYYGDGTRIEASIIEEIREAYSCASLIFQWQKGDILLLDNMQVAHGRAPFTGTRTILVAMSELFKG